MKVPPVVPFLFFASAAYAVSQTGANSIVRREPSNSVNIFLPPATLPPFNPDTIPTFPLQHSPPVTESSPHRRRLLETCTPLVYTENGKERLIEISRSTTITAKTCTVISNNLKTALLPGASAPGSAAATRDSTIGTSLTIKVTGTQLLSLREVDLYAAFIQKLIGFIRTRLSSFQTLQSKIEDALSKGITVSESDQQLAESIDTPLSELIDATTRISHAIDNSPSTAPSPSPSSPSDLTPTNGDNSNNTKSSNTLPGWTLAVIIVLSTVVTTILSILGIRKLQRHCPRQQPPRSSTPRRYAPKTAPKKTKQQEQQYSRPPATNPDADPQLKAAPVPPPTMEPVVPSAPPAPPGYFVTTTANDLPA